MPVITQIFSNSHSARKFNCKFYQCTCILSKTGSGASEATAAAAVATWEMFSLKLLDRVPRNLDTPKDEKEEKTFQAYVEKGMLAIGIHHDQYIRNC